MQQSKGYDTVICPSGTRKAPRMPFEYRPVGRSQIRVLKSQPAAESGTLSYQLIHLSQYSATKQLYSALSYTWGAPGDTLTVRVNDEDFPVRSNLYAALQQIAALSRTRKLPTGFARYLWVDAICINQGLDGQALAERSIQITQMTQIYERASHFPVCLGKSENEPNNCLAFQKMSHIDNYVARIRFRHFCGQR